MAHSEHPEHAEAQCRDTSPVREPAADLTGANQVVTAEQETWRERDFTSAILDTMGTLVVVLETRGRIVLFNRACESTTGYSFEEVKGQDVWALLIAPDEANRVRPVFEALLAGEFPNHLENDWLTRDGRRRRITWSNTAMLGKSGRVEYVIGTGIDITDRNQAEEAMRIAEQRLELAVRAARMGIFDHDMRTGQVVWSDQLARLFGLLPGQFNATFDGFLQRVHPDDRATVTATVRQAMVSDEEWVLEYRAVWPDGSLRWLEARGRVFHAGSDRMVGTVIDITERRIAQEQALTHQEQLRSLALQVSLIEEKERRRIAMDLHDGIGQDLALARLKLGNASESETGRSGKQLDQARRLIEQALGAVRSLTYELSPPILYDLGLEAALEWLVEQFQHRHGLQLSLFDDQEPKPVREEMRFLLFRAARELLVNVVKHAGARTAKLSLRRRGHNVELAVEDDGKGFATPPGRGLTGASSHNHGGFGLFSLRERVEHFGGRLEFSSLPGSGTRVMVSVPLQVPKTGQPQ